MSEYDREYYKKNREKRDEYTKQYLKKHPEKSKAYKHTWYVKNRDKEILKVQLRREKQKNRRLVTWLKKIWKTLGKI